MHAHSLTDLASRRSASRFPTFPAFDQSVVDALRTQLDVETLAAAFSRAHRLQAAWRRPRGSRRASSDATATAAAARLHPRPRRRRAWQSNTCQACQLRAAWWRAKSSRRGNVRRHGGSREQRGSARGAAAGQRQAPRRQPQRREQANPGRRRASEAVNLLWRASTRACCRGSPRRHWASGTRFSRASSSGARAATASPSGAPRRSSCATCRLRHASRLRV